MQLLATWNRGGGLLAAPPGGHLRALGRVLGDLTEIGYDAEWTTLRASDVGAPHHRARVFLIAWPRTADPACDGQPRKYDSSSRPETRRIWIRDATGGAGSSDVPNPESIGRSVWETQNHREANRESTTPTNHRDVTSDPGDERRDQGTQQPFASPPEVTTPVGALAATTDPERNDGRQGAREHRGGEETEWSAAPSGPEHRGGALPDTENDGREWGGQTRGRGSGSAHSSNRNIEWGKYAPAIRRWERVLGVASPNPTEPNSKGNPRLAAPFAEWMMGLPPGWVTDPEIGLTRSQQLKAIGNGVCPQQATAAITELLQRRTQ